MTPPLSRRSIAVRKVPQVSRRILRPKMISTLCGRPMSRLSAISASKKPRAWRGGGETRGGGGPAPGRRESPPDPGPRTAPPEWQGQPVQPPLGEHLDGARLQPVAGLLQGSRVLAGGEPVGQRSDSDPSAFSLAFDPLMPVEPDLGRIREPGADLDERRAETLIP